MAEILVTHAPEAEARADRVVNKLEKLGFKVSRGLDPNAPRRTVETAIGRAQCVLVLWSREATPALRKAAASAKAAGKLAFARLDGAAPPPILRTAAADLSGWSGREASRPWRRLLKALPPPSAGVAAKAKPKREGFVWLFVLGFVLSAAAAAGAYVMLR